MTSLRVPARTCRCAPGPGRCGRCDDVTTDGRPYARPQCRVLTDSDCDCSMCELTRVTEECGGYEEPDDLCGGLKRDVTDTKDRADALGTRSGNGTSPATAPFLTDSQAAQLIPVWPEGDMEVE